MSVRAKFKVESVDKTAEDATVKMTAVVGDSEENKKFFRWTPSGTLVLHTVNMSVADQLQPGQEYFIDITRVN